MQINRVNQQNYKSNPSFQELTKVVKTPLIVEAVEKALAPTEHYMSPIIARAAGGKVLIGEVEDELLLGVESGRGENWVYESDFLKPEPAETAETFAEKIKAAFDELFKRVDNFPNFVADVKKYLNAPQSEG